VACRAAIDQNDIDPPNGRVPASSSDTKAA